MEDYLPQDEYFEWEDILTYRKPEVVETMIHRVSISEVSSPSRSSSPGDESNTDDDAYHWNDPGIDLSMGHAPASRSIDSSVSLQTTREAETAASSISFPSYNIISATTHSSCPSCPQKKLENTVKNIKDDSDVYVAPSIYVDYFSHAWCCEDILASWRHLRSWEMSSKNAVRLENAAWRAWAKVSSDLPIVSPQEIDWLKDIDDTCLYGPFQESAHKERTIITCEVQSVTSKTVLRRSCLKKPKISELLIQGSQFSWTGARTTITTSSMKRTSPKRVVQFNEIVEQRIAVDTSRSSSPGLHQSKSFRSRNTTTAISPTTLKSQQEPREIQKVNSWNPTTLSPPPATNILAPSDRLAEWTWLGAEEEDELDWISQSPGYSNSTYSTATQHTIEEIVHDLTAKFEHIPTPPPPPTRPNFRHSPGPEDRGYVPLSDSESSVSEDEDDLIAQCLFDCDHLERSDSFTSMSASDTSSGSEDGTDEEVEFYVSGRVGREGGEMVDEKRMMERMQEIPYMDEVKRSFYEQVMEEFNAGWE